MTGQTCPRCGATLKAHRSFCSDCGAPVTPGEVVSPAAMTGHDPSAPSLPPATTPPGPVDDDAELGMTRVRSRPWDLHAAGTPPVDLPASSAATPADVPPAGPSAGSPNGTDTPPPPPVAPPTIRPPASRPASSLPPVGWTVGITFFFGLFGLIPATIHTGRAREQGVSDNRYWKAFGITFVVAILLWTAVSVAFFVIAARSISSASDYGNDSYSTLTSPTPTPAVTYEPTPTPVSQGFTGTEFIWTQTTATGDTTLARLELGAPVAPGDAPNVSDGTGADALMNCDIDEERDLLVPFDLQLTNSDESLSQQVSTQVYVELGDELGEGEGVGRAAFYTDGPDCSSPDGGGQLIGLQSTDAIGPGHRVDVGGYLILAQAVSPNHPEGDPALLAAILRPLGVEPGDSDGEGRSYAANNGPWQAGGIPVGAGGAPSAS